MFTDIMVEIRSVRGKDQIYPVCENAKMFAAGNKTLDGGALALITRMGLTIHVRRA